MSGIDGTKSGGVGEAGTGADTADVLTMTVDGQMVGIPVTQTRDVLVAPRITRVPSAPRSVRGVLNLRGRIVTAIDVRARLSSAGACESGASMCVVVDHEGELYSFLVESVGEVITVKARDLESNPPTLDPVWKKVSSGIYRLESGLLVVLDSARLLGIE